jgi:ribosomal protein S18 acetylase RimI-like enzyme
VINYYYPSAAFCVIVQGAQPIGRFYVDRSPAEIRLMEISLVPQHRNRGLGTALLNQLLQEAASDGKPLTLHVERNNPATRWYERLGLQRVAERGPYLQMEWRPESGSATTLRPAERSSSNS